jgi:hypothetical protein
MSETLFDEVKKDREPASLNISGYEKSVILERLERAVEKLKEAREEIRQAVQVILGMKEAGDDIADHAMVAVAETFGNDGNTWILSASAKEDTKSEAAKPLLLLRSE